MEPTRDPQGIPLPSHGTGERARRRATKTDRPVIDPIPAASSPEPDSPPDDAAGFEQAWDRFIGFEMPLDQRSADFLAN